MGDRRFFRRKRVDFARRAVFDYEPAGTVNLDGYLFAPVAAGLWRQRELYDGTYTFSDLADAHELMQVQAENARRALEAGRDANG